MRLRLPRGFATFLITAALTALAGLCALGGATVLERTGGWRTRLAGEMTVAIRPGPAGTSDAEVTRAAEILAGTRGVAEVRVLDRSRVAELLAPWTAGARGPDLAVLPRLIAVDLDGRAPARRQGLADALNAAGIGAIVDDHQGWRRTALDLRRQLRPCSADWPPAWRDWRPREASPQAGRPNAANRPFARACASGRRRAIASGASSSPASLNLAWAPSRGG